MKICFLFNHMNCSDGVARSAIGIANILCEYHDVTLIPIFQKDEKALVELNPKVKVKGVFGFYFRGFAKILELLPLNILYKIFIKENYDIEVAFQYGISTKVISVSNNTNAKHYCWMHTYDDGLVQKKYYLKMDKIYCVSKGNAMRLYNELEEKKEVDYCYNPIDDKRVCELGDEPIDFEKNKYMQFVSVGRHSKEKGYERLIKCADKLRNEGYDFNICLVGDGPEHNLLIDEVEKLSLQNYIYFAGAKSNPHAYTAKTDCFICSSFSEGYSTACTEAIMLNIPIITTSVSGSVEIIDDAEAGLLVSMDDESLYLGIKYVLDNPSIIEKWKITLKKTKIKFSYAEREKKLLSIFEKTDR